MKKEQKEKLLQEILWIKKSQIALLFPGRRLMSSYITESYSKFSQKQSEHNMIK